MKIKASIDRPQLEKSLKKFAHQFGDTSAQAVIRWSVQACREMAFETQPWGKKEVKKRQESAIYQDALNVVFALERLPKSKSANPRHIQSPVELIAWMDENRTKGKRTRKLPAEKKKICTTKTLKAAVKDRMKRAGIAKGGFLGAGQKIAQAQTGSDKFAIGKNFFGYAQKHMAFGDATKPVVGFTPRSTIHNRAAHTSEDYVLKKSAITKAVNFGLKKTVKWYSKTLNAIDRKKS